MSDGRAGLCTVLGEPTSFIPTSHDLTSVANVINHSLIITALFSHRIFDVAWRKGGLRRLARTLMFSFLSLFPRARYHVRFVDSDLFPLLLVWKGALGRRGRERRWRSVVGGVGISVVSSLTIQEEIHIQRVGVITLFHLQIPRK